MEAAVSAFLLVLVPACVASPFLREFGLPLLNCLLLWSRALVPPLVPKFLGLLVLVSIRLVAPSPRVLARVCVRPLRTGVYCPNATNKDGAVHNYHKR